MKCVSLIDVQESCLCQKGVSELLTVQNAISLLTYLMAEPLLVQAVLHLFSVAWQNVPSAGMNSHYRSNVDNPIPIFCDECWRTIIQLSQLQNLTKFLVEFPSQSIKNLGFCNLNRQNKKQH